MLLTVDTSGSISAVELQMFFRQLNSIFPSPILFPGYKVSFKDSYVTPVEAKRFVSLKLLSDLSTLPIIR